MLHVILPDTLIQQIEAAGVTGGAVDEFVQQAVREKLAADEPRRRFFRLSDEIRAAMSEQDLTEEQLLAEYDMLRHST
jgi:hypothetical protein